MVVYGPVLATMKPDLIERNLTTEVFESDFNGEIFIFIRKDFLDMFQVQDGVVVAGELLSPTWGKYLDDNLDRLPYWMAEVKYSTADKERGTECIEEMDKVMAYDKRRVRN